MSKHGGDRRTDKGAWRLINALHGWWGRLGARQGLDSAPATKHLPFFQVRDALQEPGCPVCRLAEDALFNSTTDSERTWRPTGGSVRSYQRSLMYENVNDPGAREEIAASNGFCHEHAWRLVEYRDVLGAAILHQDLVARFRRELASLQQGDTGGLGGRRRPPCPA